VFGCKCYILKEGTRLSKFKKKCDEGFLLGYSTTSKAYRVWNLTNGTLEEVHDVEFDETQRSQNEAQNIDDVRGDQLTNAMRNMDIGDVRPRQVDDDDIHVINQSVQINTNQASSSGSHDEAQVKVKQVEAINSQYSNLLVLHEIIHWTKSLVKFKVVFKLDQG
jgi:hypothetical protein